MSIDTTFRPISPLTFVGATAVQIIAQGANTGAAGTFRVRNISSSVQYFTWGSTSAVTSAGAPTAGVPSSNTVGLLPNSVESFEIPVYSWFIASSSTGFEFTAGIGQ